MKIKTRFAPSPTGYLHVGGARTALYSWLFARNHGGEFVLRIEDTDLERSTPEAIEAIMDGMNWLSLEWDEGPYYQTKRFDRYNAVIDQMLEEGTAYKCYCSKERLEALREEQMAKGEKPRYDGDLNRAAKSVSKYTMGEAPHSNSVGLDLCRSRSVLVRSHPLISSASLIGNSITSRCF